MRAVAKRVDGVDAPRHPVAASRIEGGGAARLALRVLGVPDENHEQLVAEIERAAIGADGERAMPGAVACA